jgi:hypothetical protein
VSVCCRPARVLPAYNAPMNFDDVGPGEDGLVRLCASLLVSLIDEYGCQPRVLQLATKSLLISQEVFCDTHGQINMLFSPAAEQARRTRHQEAAEPERAKNQRRSEMPGAIQKQVTKSQPYVILDHQSAWGLPRVITLPIQQNASRTVRPELGSSCGDEAQVLSVSPRRVNVSTRR